MTQNPPVVFLFGITPRSGTNYFYNALRAHPELDCVTSDAMPEDFLIYHSHLLVRYADLVASWWTQHWRPGRDAAATATTRAATRSRITRAFGDALVSVLAGEQPSGKVVVTKTPTVRNLGNVFQLVPQAKVLILVRDGRDQVESAVRSYGKHYDFAAQRWAESARTIIDFERSEQGVEPPRHRIVRYEDLLAEPKQTLQQTFTFLGVDPDDYDYSTPENLPVFGSSQHIPEGQDLRQTYQRLERTADFNPRGRWAHWDDDRLERFNYIAGAEMEHFGYELAGPRPSSTATHRLKDIPFRLRTAALASLDLGDRWASGVRAYRQLAARFPLQQ